MPTPLQFVIDQRTKFFNLDLSNVEWHAEFAIFRASLLEFVKSIQSHNKQKALPLYDRYTKELTECLANHIPQPLEQISDVETRIRLTVLYAAFQQLNFDCALILIKKFNTRENQSLLQTAKKNLNQALAHILQLYKVQSTLNINHYDQNYARLAASLCKQGIDFIHQAFRNIHTSSIKLSCHIPNLRSVCANLFIGNILANVRLNDFALVKTTIRHFEDFFQFLKLNVTAHQSPFTTQELSAWQEAIQLQRLNLISFGMMPDEIGTDLMLVESIHAPKKTTEDKRAKLAPKKSSKSKKKKSVKSEQSERTEPTNVNTPSHLHENESAFVTEDTEHDDSDSSVISETFQNDDISLIAEEDTSVDLITLHDINIQEENCDQDESWQSIKKSRPTQQSKSLKTTFMFIDGQDYQEFISRIWQTISQHDEETALNALVSAPEKYRKNGYFWALMRCYVNLKQHRNAIDALSQLVNPKPIITWQSLAYCHEKLEEYEIALSYCKKILDKDAHHKIALAIQAKCSQHVEHITQSADVKLSDFVDDALKSHVNATSIAPSTTIQSNPWAKRLRSFAVIEDAFATYHPPKIEKVFLYSEITSGIIERYTATSMINQAFDFIPDVKEAYVTGSAVLSLINNQTLTDYQDIDIVLSETELSTVRDNPNLIISPYNDKLYHAKRELSKIPIDYSISTDADTQSIDSRDFTISCLYCSRKGEIFDPSGQGLQDNEQKILRSILPPTECFEKDPVRLLRAIKYMLLDYKPTNDLLLAMQQWQPTKTFSIEERNHFHAMLHKALMKPDALAFVAKFRELGLVSKFFQLQENIIYGPCKKLLTELRAQTSRQIPNNTPVIADTSVEIPASPVTTKSQKQTKHSFFSNNNKHSKTSRGLVVSNKCSNKIAKPVIKDLYETPTQKDANCSPTMIY
jgi:tetratricopeptide (TPR) repeat protein